MGLERGIGLALAELKFGTYRRTYKRACAALVVLAYGGV